MVKWIVIGGALVVVTFVSTIFWFAHVGAAADPEND